MAKNQFLNWEILDLFKFSSLFAWTFLNFLAFCEYVGIEIIPKYFYVLTVNISS